MVIRKMVAKDAEDASQITGKIMINSWERREKGYYPRKAVDFNISTRSHSHFADSLETDTNFSFVAEENGRVAGVVMGRRFGDSGLASLGWLGVLPEFWNQGIGRELLERAIADCTEKG